MKDLVIGDAPLGIADLAAVAREGRRVALGEAARERLAAARAVVDQVVAEERVAYGVTTGFGQLATTHIPAAKVRELQQNLVRSHAVGVGAPLPRDVVRAAMLIRASTMSKGYSGVRAELVELLVGMLNADVVPYVPSRGSLGASGDLAPSAHVVLAMLGEGEVIGADPARRLRASGASRAGPPCGPPGSRRSRSRPRRASPSSTAPSSWPPSAPWRSSTARTLLDSADLIGAMSIEGLRASVGPFQERIQRLRPIPGQLETAEHVRRATAGSEIMLSHLNCDKVQDAYSIRCIPQVHGACRDAFRWLREVIDIEIESVTDNPIIFPDTGEIISAGNFHGEPLALALDLAAMSFAEIGSMSERRIFRMLSPFLSELPPYLTDRQRPQQRLHDRPVHGGRPGRREQGPLSPGERRLDPQLGRPGGPRQHGHDRGAQARGRGAQHADDPRHRGAVRGAGDRPAGAAQARRRDGARATRSCAGSRRSWSATATWRPRSRPRPRPCVRARSRAWPKG